MTQFAAAVLLVAGAAVAHQQTTYLEEAPLGFNEDHVLAIRSVPRDWTPEGVERLQHVKTALKAVPGVRAVSLSWETAAEGGGNTMPLRRAGQPIKATQHITRFVVDTEFDDVYELDLLAGRFFEPGADTDGVLLNEQAAAALGINGLDQPLVLGDSFQVAVQGIVRDFHYESLHAPLGPLVIAPLSEVPLYRTLSLRIAVDDVAGTLARVQDAWREVLPGAPFEYSFVEDDVAEQYVTEQRTGAVVGLAAALALVVAALGLVGLVSLSVLQRRKEIGLRKVLGASVLSIVALFVRDFGVLVLGGGGRGRPAHLRAGAPLARRVRL